MRIWDISGPDVEAADAEPWNGLMASTMRPFKTQSLVRLAFAAGLLITLGGMAALVLHATSPTAAAHGTLWLLVSIWWVVTGLAIFVMLAVSSPQGLRRVFPLFAFTNTLAATPVLTLSLYAGGPDLGVVAAAYTEAPIFAFFMLRRRWAVLSATMVLTLFAALLVLQDGWVAPVGQWSILLAVVVATALLVGDIAERSDLMAAAEHEARVELADMNTTLETRVADQVTEIERLGELRRFLSPQVADAVTSGDSEALTNPHRQRIAVLFCDLRGFTAFTNGAEPEEVVGVLDEYYRAVGEVLQRYEATIGGYAGDGIMAYLGDPVPMDDPALAAVRMVSELRAPLDELIASWERHGHDLHYGIGLSFGYATLGVVGFDGRYDYTPLGAVVNLAARLCGQASAGQVLLDHATHAATREEFASAHHADLDLKGYGQATRAYALA